MKWWILNVTGSSKIINNVIRKSDEMTQVLHYKLQQHIHIQRQRSYKLSQKELALRRRDGHIKWLPKQEMSGGNIRKLKYPVHEANDRAMSIYLAWHRIVSEKRDKTNLIYMGIQEYQTVCKRCIFLNLSIVLNKKEHVRKIIYPHLFRDEYHKLTEGYRKHILQALFCSLQHIPDEYLLDFTIS